MNIQPKQIDQSGEGIDLTNLPSGISIAMAGLDKDFKYNGNIATLTVDLSGFEQVSVSFDARETGDEPHWPRDSEGNIRVDEAGVFGPVADFEFDGVSISADGIDWYEIRGLRDLNTKLRHIEIDLDAAVLEAGIGYNSSFMIRFSQFDNGPVAWDGISLSNIQITGQELSPFIHLPMDDNGFTAVVRDIAGDSDQTFLDPTGNPITIAHSVLGPHGNWSLDFDGIDDRIFLDSAISSLFGFGKDFTFALWLKFSTDVISRTGYVFYGGGAYNAPDVFSIVTFAPLTNRLCFCLNRSDGTLTSEEYSDVNDDTWHHYAITRKATTFKWYRDGLPTKTDTDARNEWSFSRPGQSISGQAPAANKFAISDLRMYQTALTDSQVGALMLP